MSFRPLAYMAGNTTPLFLGVIERLLSGPWKKADRFTLVIGDKIHYRWALEQKSDPRIRLIYQHEWFDPWQAPMPDQKQVAEFEERYGIPNLRRYLIAQRIIDRLPEERKLAYLIAYLRYFESLWSEHRPDVLISGGADSLPFFVAHEVFKRNGCPLMALIPSRITGRFHVVDNELEQVPFLRETFEALAGEGLTPEEKALARNVREAHVKKRIRPSYYGIGARVRPLPSVLRMAEAVWRCFWHEDWYFDAPLRSHVLNGLKVRLRQPFQKAQIRRLISPLPANGRFFYYPLHYEPEFSIDILGSTVRNQLQLIRRISSLLPARYLLCVKEHPNMFPGSRPFGFYQRLVECGNVRLIDPATDGYDIISRCRGVVTISGTSGYEALFLDKPVLVLGRAFYDQFHEGVIRAGGNEEIAGALQQMKAGHSFDPDDLDRFVVALYRCSYSGAYEHTIQNIHEASNYQALADGVAAGWSWRISHAKQLVRS